MLQKKILHVEWHCPISELAEQFDHFRSTNVIGIANDLSPHYRYVKYVDKFHNSLQDVHEKFYFLRNSL